MLSPCYQWETTYLPGAVNSSNSQNMYEETDSKELIPPRQRMESDLLLKNRENQLRMAVESRHFEKILIGQVTDNQRPEVENIPTVEKK